MVLKGLSLVAAVASLSGATPPAQAASGAPRTVLQYGDSLTIGTAAYLSDFLPGWTSSESASISRHARSAPTAMRSLGVALPRVLVISLGTNDDPSAVSAFAGDVRRVVTTAGRGRCVIWATVVRPPYNGVSYDGYNRVLRRAARSYRTFRLFDWASLAQTHPRWLATDGVHPTADGYRARAAALAKLVTTC